MRHTARSAALVIASLMLAVTGCAADTPAEDGTTDYGKGQEVNQAPPQAGVVITIDSHQVNDETHVATVKAGAPFSVVMTSSSNTEHSWGLRSGHEKLSRPASKRRNVNPEDMFTDVETTYTWQTSAKNAGIYTIVFADQRSKDFVLKTFTLKLTIK